MFSINHDIEIKSSARKLFSLLVMAEGLEKWWSKKSNGNSGLGQTMEVYFSDEYDWEMKCIEYIQDRKVVWNMTRAMEDWMPTTISFELLPSEENKILLRFTHSGWERVEAHFRRSSLCWALYLRILKRYIENEEFVLYEKRTSV